MDSGHCTNYRIFKKALKFENYLTVLNYKQASNLCRFRTGNYKLPIVAGRLRFSGVARNERLCNLCNTNSIGDEFHYIFQCKTLEKERSMYIDAKFLGCPNTLVMKRLFNSEDHTTLSKLAMFCSIIMGKFKTMQAGAKKLIRKEKSKGKRAVKAKAKP